MKCWEPVACEEYEGASEILEDKDGESCRALCQDKSDCLWFTYDDSQITCTLIYGKCTSFVEQENVFTSQHSCNRQLKGF